MSAASFSRSATRAAPLTAPDWLLRAFALDVRGLSFLRIGLGAILLIDLAGRAQALTAHYTDDGILPRAARMAMEWDFCEPWWMSLHMLSGSWWWQATLFTIAAIAATMLLAGYRTKLALSVSWLLLLSLHGRFPLLTQGGDMLLRCMLLWSLFLPLDARWSLANAEKGVRKTVGEGGGTYVVSMGTAAFVVQLAAMYLFTGMLKTAPSWRGDYSAAYYALAIDHFTSELGYVALGYPRVLQLLTFTSLVLECAAPLLLLAPIGHKWVRTFVPLAFIGFHLGLATTMDLGTFPWICILFWIVLLPPPVWDRIEQCCPFSNGSSGTCEPSAVRTIGSMASSAIAAFLLGYVVLLNINRLYHPMATVGRPPLAWLGKATGLEQYWNMFSPGPYQFGGWLRIEGETEAGRLVNLYAPDEPLPATKPANVSSTYATQYWRRCLVTMYEFQETPHMEGGLRYFARQWNATHPTGQRVIRARLVHMVESVPPPFEQDEAPRSVERRVVCQLAL